MPHDANARHSDPHMSLITTPVQALLKHKAVALPSNASIRQAAECMREARVSSVLLVDNGRLVGVVTDRDLRNRVVAAGLDTGEAIERIATRDPWSIDITSPAFDALLLMARHNIHHVPVMEGGHVAGMVTATDLTEYQNNSAVYLAGAIHKQTTLDGLVQTSARIKQLQQGLAAAEASAYSTGHIVTAMTDALTTRLLQLGENELGPPPVPYAWVAAGSQARNEQTAKSDQDNCMILDDAYDEARHGAYFKTLAEYVCGGLDACGYVYCPGEMMAMTDEWRQPLRQWLRYFSKWVMQPDPKALMLTCVFFDQRFVHGHQPLLDELRQEVRQMTKNQGIFLAFMAANALTHPPPLGWLGNIRLTRRGEHRGTVDLKMGGIAPIVDLARVYALASGTSAVNTHDRLKTAASSGEITEQGARDLRDALDYLAGLRIQHQARRMSDGHAADNYLRPEELSNFERGHLKNAFQVVKNLQHVLGERYQTGRF
jgi:CBS domain-containing protein